MTITIDLPPEKEQKVLQRAKERGQDVSAYVNQIIDRDIAQPTFAEILAPIHEDVRKSGMTEVEINALIEESIREVRADRKKKQQG